MTKLDRRSSCVASGRACWLLNLIVRTRKTKVTSVDVNGSARVSLSLLTEVPDEGNQNDQHLHRREHAEEIPRLQIHLRQVTPVVLHQFDQRNENGISYETMAKAEGRACVAFCTCRNDEQGCSSQISRLPIEIEITVPARYILIVMIQSKRAIRRCQDWKRWASASTDRKQD